jgi:hypothetical protein
LTVTGTSISCTKMTLSGTTNSTKTNYVNATPAFSSCLLQFVSEKLPIVFENTACKVKGTVPWTVTLAEGKERADSGLGAIALNCGFTFTVTGEGCVLTVGEQTAGGELGWSGKVLRLDSNNTFKCTVSNKNNKCAAVGISSGRMTLAAPTLTFSNLTA